MGFKEIYKKQVMHRDLKLANILIHFSDPFVLEEMQKFRKLSDAQEKLDELKAGLDLTKIQF